MPGIKRSAITATGDALNGLKFKTWTRPTLVTLAASTSAVGEPNLEVANQVVDVDRDAMLIREPAPAGEHFLDITAAGTDTAFALFIEAL